MSGFWGLVIKPGAKPTPMRTQSGDMVMVLKQVRAADIGWHSVLRATVARPGKVLDSASPLVCAGGSRAGDWQDQLGDRCAVCLGARHSLHASEIRQPLESPVHAAMRTDSPSILATFAGRSGHQRALRAVPSDTGQGRAVGH